LTARTKSNCTCNTPCGASFEVGIFQCDWCYTKDKCGKRSITGAWWDYCAYTPQADELRTATQKLDDLWEHVVANNQSQKAKSAAGCVTESVQTSFSNFADTFPEGRKKYIHSIGAVCKFELDISPFSPYTGLFKKQNKLKGLIRMGSALPVDVKSGVVPGIGIKFLRSNIVSANFVALKSLSAIPDQNYNFFSVALSNHIPPGSGYAAKLLTKKFKQASQCPTQVGLSDICTYDEEGVKEQNVVFPFKVILESALSIPSTPTDEETFQRHLLFPNGTALYTLKAVATKGTEPLLLGTLTTTDHCSNSYFGDTKLFFRHQLVEEDWAQNRAFMAANDGKRDCDASKRLTPTPPRENSICF